MGAQLRAPLKPPYITALNFNLLISSSKVVKLHQKLGKPIPSDDPVVVGKTAPTTAAQPATAAQAKCEWAQAINPSETIVLWKHYRL